MNAMGNKGKLILAVVQKDDYDMLVEELNERKIFFTRLSSSGGFLRRENITIMIGVDADRLNEVNGVLRQCAGRRRRKTLVMPAMNANVSCPGVSVPVEETTGGVAVFTLDLEQMEKF